jgi:predicted transcriptional regulator
MTYVKLQELIDAQFHHRCSTWERGNITNFVASDLMSDVLTVDDEDFVLVTSLTSDQVARTADIVGARAILLVNGKQPQNRLIELVGELNISLLSCKERMFKTCYILGQALSEEGISL